MNNLKQEINTPLATGNRAFLCQQNLTNFNTSHLLPYFHKANLRIFFL